MASLAYSVKHYLYLFIYFEKFLTFFIFFILQHFIMVQFKDYHNCLAVLLSKDDKIDEGILFPVDKAIFSRNSPIFEKFVVSLALEE